MTAQQVAAGEYSRANAGTDSQKNCVRRSTCRAMPGLTEDVCGTIAVDGDVYLRAKSIAQLLQQWIIVPAVDVRRPHSAAVGAVDARYAYAHRLASVLHHQFPHALCDQSPDRRTASLSEWIGLTGDDVAFAGEGRNRQLGPAEIRA